MSICDRNCFACQFEDCICDELEYQDYLMLDSLEKEIVHPKTAQRRKAACQKAYREANKEKIAAYQKAYREANKEKIKAKKKAHYEANKEKIAAYQKAYYEANKEKIAAYQKAHYDANKEKIKAQKKAYYEVRKKGKGPAGAGTPDKPNKKYIQT
jgi:hypothetical protein